MKTLLVLLILLASCSTYHMQVGQEQNTPVVIGTAGVSNINSVGGIDVLINFTNTSGRTINYLTFVIEAYNRVGDPVRCEIKRSSTAALRATGPYQHGRGTSLFNPGQWKVVMYNRSISEIRIKQIVVEYDNRQEEIIAEKDIIYSR